MNLRKKTLALLAVPIVGLLVMGNGCNDPAAKTASENTSSKADNFEVQRKIVGINTRTDKYLFYVEGRCSIEREADALVTMCKYAEDDYRKNYLGKATDVAWVSTQEAPINVSEYHTRVVLKPEGIIPAFELNLSK
jgi:hypothetical protein